MRELGGITARTVSHPHFYASLIEWSDAFGGAPVYIPEADRGWVTRDDPVIEYWSGSAEVAPGITLIQCGGHFEGSAVLHWPAGAGGKGAPMTGDTISVVRDRRFVTFMRSYPNEIPLPQSAVRQIVDAAHPSHGNVSAPADPGSGAYEPGTWSEHVYVQARYRRASSLCRMR